MIKNLKFSFAVIIIFCIFFGGGIYFFRNYSNKSLEKQIIAMNGLNIDLSFDKAEAFYGGIDSTYNQRPVKKLVVFVDSTKCSSCFVRHLDRFFEINHILKEYNGDLIIVLQPPNIKIEELKVRVKKRKYPFWCILDKYGEFVHNNRFILGNKLFHTFMLDKYNKIIILGDPSINPRINELFQKELLME